MAIGTKVKTKWMVELGGVLVGAGLDLPDPAADIWIPQEPVRVIGAWVSVQVHYGAAPAFQEGRCFQMGFISRVAAFDTDGMIVATLHNVTFWTEIVVADQLAGCFAESGGDGFVMFPAGTGVDLDSGEPLYLGRSFNAEILSAGSLSGYVRGLVYYVER